MNSFNKTEAAVFSCRLCFLRAFPFISLSKTHQAGNCFSKFRYRTCKGKHHTSICESSQKPAHFYSNSENSRSGDTSHSVFNERAAILHTSSMSTHSNVLFKTAVLPICAGGRYADANILMDEGHRLGIRLTASNNFIQPPFTS